MINNYKIGFMASLGYSEMEIGKVAESISKIGYDALELTLNHFHPDMSEKELIKIINIIEENDLKVSEIVAQQDLILLNPTNRRENISFIKNCIKKYSQVGIDTINLFTGPVPWIPDPLIIGKDVTMGEAWELLFQAFDEIVPIAEENKMNLAIENVWGMLANDFFSAIFLQNHYKSNYLGVNFDPSHDLLKGNLDIQWIIKNWGSKIKHVHIKDAVGTQEAGKFIFPLIGEGNVNWMDFFKALKEINYNGYCSVEFESFTYLSQIWDNDIETAAKVSYSALKKIINTLGD